MSAGEAGVDFVPVGNGGFAEFPAEEDFASAVEGREIDEAGGPVLEFATDVDEFVLEARQLVGELLGAALQVFQASARGGGALIAVHVGAHVEEGAVSGGDVGDDALNEDEGTVGLGGREELSLGAERFPLRSLTIHESLTAFLKVGISS